MLPRLCVTKNACELRLVQIGFVALGVVLPCVRAAIGANWLRCLGCGVALGVRIAFRAS